MSNLSSINLLRFRFKQTVAACLAKNWGNGLIYGVLAAGVLYRLLGLGTSAFWYDEAFSIYLARLPVLRLLTVASWEIHPPLWELVLSLFIRLFGMNEISARLPAFLASVGSLWMFFRLTQYFRLSKGGQIVALILASFSPYQIWMAQDARSYALQCFCYLLAVCCVINRKWLGMIISLSLLFYTNNVGIFYGVTVVLLALGLWPKDWLRVFSVAGVSVLLFSLWTPPMLRAATLPGFSIGPLGMGKVIRSIYEIFFINSFQKADIASLGIYLIIFTIAFVLVTPIGRITLKIFEKTPSNPKAIISTKKQITLGWIALGPMVIMLFVSLIFRNVIFYRPISGIALPLILWVTMIIEAWRLKFIKVGLAFLWLTLIVYSLMTWSPVSKGGTLQLQANFIQEQLQPGDILYHATATSLMPFSLYLPDQSTYLLDETLSWRFLVESMQTEYDFQKEALENIEFQRAWIIWARDPELSPQANQRMTEYVKNAVLIGRINYWQASPIEIYLLAKDKQP